MPYQRRIHSYAKLPDGTHAGRTLCEQFPSHGSQTAPMTTNDSEVTCNACKGRMK